jgi:succinate-semialdehyde dehydrogenase / glutarate-semialdehyde dehydrogenase
MKSFDPATNRLLREYPEHSRKDVEKILGEVQLAWTEWKSTSFMHRRELMKKAAAILRERKEELAGLMTSEMGKIIRESRAEIEKCAVTCDYYAENAEAFLADLQPKTDASRTIVAFQPLGVILAVMPWNFPFWQVFRFAAPALMAGNAAVLKHASNVPGCALAIEQVFGDAGFPDNLFRTLMIPSGMVEQVIANPVIKAVTLTGSEYAGSQVASAAGKLIKKTVLELGGSDPFIVLEDADLDLAVKTAATARMINQGQSCIAAKRFIVHDLLADQFVARMKDIFESFVTGDPSLPETQVAPLARPDLVDDIERQVNESVAAGAILITGGTRIAREGCYFQPTILDHVKKGMAAYKEETFGPLLAVIRINSEKEAIAVANDSEFGLGGCVFTRDPERGERVARAVETGAMFVNGLVKSDPRIPFGGIKKSGYGRELSDFGIREFVNVKTIWIG